MSSNNSNNTTQATGPTNYLSNGNHPPNKFANNLSINGTSNSRQSNQLASLTENQSSIMNRPQGQQLKQRINLNDIMQSTSSQIQQPNSAQMSTIINNRQQQNNSVLSEIENTQIAQIQKENSPTSYEIKGAKSKSQGRKGHQVSQSAGFKQLKQALNKSFDIHAQNELIKNPNNSNNIIGGYQSYLNIQSVQNQQSPTQQKTNSISNVNNIVSQFQTMQSNASHNRRNQALINHSVGGGFNHTKKAHSNSIDRNNTNGSKLNKPNSRPGGASVDLTGFLPNSRGSRFITSNNKRGMAPQDQIDLGILNEATRNAGELQQTSIMMNTNIKANLIDANKIITAQQQSQPSHFKNNRPKTSFGYQSYLDKYNTNNIGNQENETNTSDTIDIQQIANTKEQKSFIIKKGEKNEGLRNYLRKSLDSAANTTQTNINIPQLTATFNNPSNEIQKPQRIKRKRDYSKVVAGGSQQFMTIQQTQQQIQLQQQFIPNFSPQKSVKNQVKKNLYQEQFNLMNEQKQSLLNQINQTNIAEDNIQPQFSTIQQDKPGIKKQQASGLHSRSQTSHKLNRVGHGVNALQQQTNNAISQFKTNSHLISEELTTIQGDDQNVQRPDRIQNLKSRSEERPSSKYGNQQTQLQNNFNNLRASIQQEVTTAQPTTDGNIGNNSNKKVDNCVSKFAFATKTGFSPSNPYKVNQDSFLAMPHLGEYRRTHFFSVCDGHGVYGKEVSEFCKYHLGQRVEIEIKQIFDNAKQLQRVVDSNEVKDALSSSFAHVTHQLYTNSGIDIYFSGSTCVSILIVGNKVFCANVGDSRAVLAREFDGGSSIQGIPLNRDHKASEPDEEKRILQAGGRIEAFKDSQGRSLGPLRVWHLNENIPGLAMSRSFGDHAAAEVGVIPEPEILELNLCEDDKFIVIASDGVWEFLSNDEVSRIVWPHYKNNSAEKAAEALIKESLKKWKQEENVVDDITCIIIFLSIQ